MENWALFLLGVIQLGTGISMFLSVNQTHIFGIATLSRNLSVYRYMLTALWLSVSIIYFVGSFNSLFTLGAALLAIINVLFEIIGYWLSKLPRWYQVVGTVVMGILGAWSGSSLFY